MKWAKYLNRNFTKEDVDGAWDTHTHRRRYSMPSVIRKTQTPIPSAGEVVEKLAPYPSPLLVGVRNAAALWRRVCQFLMPLNVHLRQNPAITRLGIRKREENWFSHNSLYGKGPCNWRCVAQPLGELSTGSLQPFRPSGPPSAAQSHLV